MIGRRVGRFLITEKIGQGGMATVWKAQDQLLGRSVAVKILSADLAMSARARRRFLHEAQAAALLDHPNVAMVHDTGEAGELPYIAYSYVDGETVSQRIARSLLPISEAVWIVREAAAGLAHAHARGVVHRDVTSRNIMIARDRRVVVLDFGLALAATLSRQTSSGTAIGTVAYMSPEAVKGSDADPRTDVYGLGIVLYEALTGAMPFTGDRPEAVIHAILNADPRSPSALRPDVPPALEDVVLRALARDVAERYQSADALIEALRGIDPVIGSDDAAHASVKSSPTTALRPTSDSRQGPVYIALLPIAVADAAAGEQPHAIARGLVETLGAELTDASGVHVIRSEDRLDDVRPQAARALGEKLGANVLLRGSLRVSGTRVRVTYSLLDPWSGAAMKGDALDGSVHDVFGFEDAVVTSVRSALGLRDDARTVKRRDGSHDPAAHEHFLQAIAYLQRSDSEASIDGGIALLERLLATEEETAALHAALCRAFVLKHRLTKHRQWETRAATECGRAMELDRESVDAAIAHADLLSATGRHAEAVDRYSEALAADPQAHEAIVGLAECLAAAGRWNEAEQTARKAIDHRPHDWRGYYVLGVVYARQGQYARAIEPWRTVVRLTPDNARGHHVLGSAFYRLDRVDDAIAAYLRSIAIQPNALAYTNLGTVYFYSSRYEEATAAFEKAKALLPTDAVMWGNLGCAYRLIPGHEKEAMHCLDTAIALMREHLARNPPDADALARYAAWLANREMFPDARRAIEEALSLAASNVECIARAGTVFLQLDERERALDCFRDAVRRGYGTGRLRRDPELAPLMADPEFMQILEEVPPGREEHDDDGG